jgi:hypothetical protein
MTKPRPFPDLSRIEPHEVGRAALAAASRVGLALDDERQVRDLAAVAIARLAWRDSPVEDWHAAPDTRITDADLMRANVAVTREVRSLLVAAPTGKPRPPEPNAGAAARFRSRLAAVSEALTDPDRRLPDGRRLHRLAPDGEHLASYTEHVVRLTRRWAALAELVGSRVTLLMLACTCVAACPRWWLAPDWPYLVEEFIARLTDPSRWGSEAMAAHVAQLAVPLDAADVDALRRTLLAGPDHLTTATARYCLQAGIGHLLPQHYGRPPRQRRVLPESYQALIDARSLRTRPDPRSTILHSDLARRAFGRPSTSSRYLDSKKGQAKSNEQPRSTPSFLLHQRPGVLWKKSRSAHRSQ